MPMTGQEYLDSLRDGRHVWIDGDLVDDVTSHPAFRTNARVLAGLYDALHEGGTASGLLVPTDTGSGGLTHPYFKAPHSTAELRQGLDGILAWARRSYGWLGRPPDFKAAFLSTLGSNPAHYAPFEANAARWYQRAQERVLFVGHGIVNPPVDRDRGMSELSEVYVTVERETDAGLYVSGAKVVGTGAALTQYLFIGSYGQIPQGCREFSAFFIVPTNAPGVRLIARRSYEQVATQLSTPFDSPLSSRFDENDAILVFDNVFIPWEDVFCYDVEKANDFFVASGFFARAMMHACARFAVRLDFLTGLLARGVETTGTAAYRGVQARLGELVAHRNAFWALLDSMVLNPTPWPDGTVTPNADTCLAFRVLATSVYPRLKEIFFRDLGSALIYGSSSAADWSEPELRTYLDRYVRGRDTSAVERAKLMKLTWDALGSEFGGRWELYEMNYAGNHEQVRYETLAGAQHGGVLQRCTDLVQQCLDDYDLDGWRAPTLRGPWQATAAGASR